MRILLAGVGTGGDVYPFIGVGAALRRRGHDVVLAANEDFGEAASQQGLEFVPLIRREDTARLLADPDLWHPLRCGLAGARLGRDFLDSQVRIIEGLARRGKGVDLAVTATSIVAARFLQEREGLPLISVILQPWMVPSSIAPPVMPGGWTLPAGLPAPVGQVYWWLVDRAGDFLVARHFQARRRAMGLPPIRRMFRWWLSPLGSLGLFPDWYAPRQEDWPAGVETTCFPLHDGEPEEALPADLEAFLEGGDPPVAFTFGTGMTQAREVFERVVEACRLLDLRALLLTRHAEQLPDSLPESLLHVPFAPFSKLLPRVAALTHHGGIGTTAQALRAGTPQLVLPFAFDQFDNARRIRRLGIGDRTPSSSPPRRLAAALERTLEPGIRLRSGEIAENFGSGDPLDEIAGRIEALASIQAAPS